MNPYLSFLLYSTLIYSTKCAPITDEKGMNYLMNFGYTNNKTMDSMTDTDMKEVIEEYQKFANIPMTGVMDDATKKMMQTPRCKMQDQKIFIYTGRWNNSHLTYKFLNFPKNINNYSESTIVDLVTKALKLWINQVDLTIERIIGDEIKSDINIKFDNISNLSSSEGVVLANAAFPAVGDINYLDENWNEISDEPLDLYQITVHEFGHSLGLYHVDDINSVMYPYFIYKENFQMNSTDIEYIENLYGKKYSPCENGNIDAALAISPYIFIFRGFQVWMYYYGSLKSEYPKLLSEEFPGLKSSVNATFYHNNYIYFIQGTEVLKYNGTYTNHFDILENDYDAAVTIEDRLYTFKGLQYWRYNINETGMTMVRVDYPRNISRLWKGVPGDIDAVYYDGDAHFFKGTSYFKFDTNVLYNDAVQQPISEWEGCKNN